MTNARGLDVTPYRVICNNVVRALRSPITAMVAKLAVTIVWVGWLLAFLLLALSMPIQAAPAEIKVDGVNGKIYVRVTDASGVTKCAVAATAFVAETITAITNKDIQLDAWFAFGTDYTALSATDQAVCFAGIPPPPPPPPQPPAPETKETYWVWFNNGEPTTFCNGPLLGEYPGKTLRQVVMAPGVVGMALCTK